MRSQQSSPSFRPLRGLFLVVLGIGFAGGCLGANPDSQSQCQIFGGVCVASVNQCGGSLPYDCNSGICCEGVLPGTADATFTQPSGDATTLMKDVTIPPPMDATTGHDTGMDVSVSTPDVGTQQDTGMQTMPDTGMTLPDAGSQDAPAAHDAHEDAHEDTGVDAHQAEDTGTKDAGEDSKSYDGGHRDLDAGFICNHYASPNEPESSFPGTATLCNPPGSTFECPGNPLCQPNGCYNGDYCHLTTGNCIAFLAVTCDGGL